MCGIAGVAYADPRHPVGRELLRRMTDVMRHRGPDADGFHVGAGVGLGHRRLSIIDVAGGDQPIYGEDRRTVVVLNGEIYNFRDLREELIARGHVFTTRTDTEVIVHAYEAYGPACVERLAGMFAFALWDEARRRLLLARDRLGKKPLYYHVRGGDRLLFASELKALLQDPSVKRAPDLVALADYFAFGAVAGPRTAVEGVAQVPPAHYLVWEDGQVRLTEYWQVPPAAPAHRSEADTLAAFDEALCRAVQARLVSDVPLGAFLSGGVDSSAVVEAMARLSDRPVVTTAVGFTEQRYSELPYARLVAEALGTDHREVVVEPRAAEILPRLAWHLDEPFADSSALPTYYVARAARERVTVALSGDGGDEVFAGYQRRYGLNGWERRVRRWLPAGLLRAVAGPLGRWYPKADWLPRALRARYVLQNLAVSFERAYFNDLCLFRDDERARLLAPDFQRAVAGHDPFEVVGVHLRPHPRARPARPAPLRRPQDVAAQRHPGQGGPDEHGQLAGGPLAVPRPPAGRVRGDRPQPSQVPRPDLQVPGQAPPRGAGAGRRGPPAQAGVRDPGLGVAARGAPRARRGPPALAPRPRAGLCAPGRRARALAPAPGAGRRPRRPVVGAHDARTLAPAVHRRRAGRGGQQ